MKVGMRTPSLKKSVKAQTTGKVKRAVKKSVSPGYGQKGVGWIKDPKKAAYNKVYNKTTFGVGDVYRGIGGNGSRSSSNSSFSGSAAEIPEVRIPSKLEKVLTSSEKKKYISLVQTGCVLDLYPVSFGNELHNNMKKLIFSSIKILHEIDDTIFNPPEPSVLVDFIARYFRYSIISPGCISSNSHTVVNTLIPIISPFLIFCIAS